EPFQGLDPFFTEKLITLLMTLKNQGRTIMINDHSLSHTMRLADKIVFLIQHQIILTLPYSRIRAGLLYQLPDEALRTSNGKPSFSDRLFTTPPDSPHHLHHIQNLTELYTLAIQHEKHSTI